ncbi:hypothetical protein BSR29_02690 [Boudabousia liubingyangii]|uniref:Phospholipid/glycerol acyltransferase domain-containing protein n=1 Tax=Boudabousia liubingyangii TaxID=1921764 RepID=A0A1Q5PMK7_9ACTO|nr:lysophospholipid acyltransferase family protein [Boudabousia liubingyangii]OKL47413.1 hypothetical protein BSR28_02550 [Boudabousia liubingyangii]OKL48784.1 hypothetical protein BSR29_02690 [Boudabousia liubingyangii]
MEARPWEPRRATKIAGAILGPVYRLVTRAQFEGYENLPKKGGYLVVSNHSASFDAVTMVFFFLKGHKGIRFAAKHTLFSAPILGPILKAMGHVPVYRQTKRAANIISQCSDAINHGAIIGIYPEGTTTREAQYWPMTAKTGAAKIALNTGCPIIPVIAWGNQQFLPRYSLIPRFWRRPRIQVKALPPLNYEDLLSAYTSGDDQAPRALSDRIMAVITEELATMRGEEAPERPYDMRIDGDPWGKVARAELAKADLPEIRRQRRLSAKQRRAQKKQSR